MTQSTSPEAYPFQTEPPKLSRGAVAGGVVIALLTGLVGFGLGTASSPEAETVPAVTVTQSAAPAPTVTVTEEGTDGLPPECEAALNSAIELYDEQYRFDAIVGQHVMDEGNLIDSVSEGDIEYGLMTYLDTIEEYLAAIKEHVSIRDGNTFPSDSKACQEAIR